jgi:hypothetical protein
MPVDNVPVKEDNGAKDEWTGEVEGISDDCDWVVVFRSIFSGEAETDGDIDDCD